jgi:SPP1 family phage portal protein
MKIRLNPNQPLTPELIRKIVELNLQEEARRQKLANYYVGKQQIANRQMGDTSKPNNRLAHSYGNYITDTITGYFMGQPVSYVAKTAGDNETVENLREIFTYNDEQSENVELAKESSKIGVSYELHYVDNDGNPRFKAIDGIRSIPVYDNTLNEELIYFIRYYNEDIMNPEVRTVEVYSAFDINYYTYNGEELKFIGNEEHAYGMVPVAVFYNNTEELGDYELVISLIDAYDKLASDAVNDFETFADAYLKLSGLDATEPEDIAKMKEQRVLILPEGADAQWLIKQVNDTYFQNTTRNIDADIHKFAKVPNLMDQAFGSNLSGIAIKYKLMGLENKVAIKESWFRKGLQRRIELIGQILNLFGNDFDYLGVDIVFKRNIPANEAEAVEMVNKLVGIISEETAISQLPFIEDAKAELERKNAQFDLLLEPIGNEPVQE